MYCAFFNPYTTMRYSTQKYWSQAQHLLHQSDESVSYICVIYGLIDVEFRRVPLKPKIFDGHRIKFTSITSERYVSTNLRLHKGGTPYLCVPKLPIFKFFPLNMIASHLRKTNKTYRKNEGNFLIPLRCKWFKKFSWLKLSIPLHIPQINLQNQG